MIIESEVKNELLRWKNNIFNNFNPIRNFNFNLEIFTDSSKTVQGIHCNSNNYVDTYGFWDNKDRLKSINFLELKTVYYGLKCYAKNLESCEILFRVDNTTDIAYINKMGGTHFLN